MKSCDPQSIVFPLDGNAEVLVPLVVPYHLEESSQIFINRLFAEPLFRSVSKRILGCVISDEKNGIIDIGSWKSDNSLPWAANWPSAQVFAIDPSPLNIAFGEYIASYNHLRNVVHIHHACGKSPAIPLSFSGSIDHASFVEESVESSAIYTSTIDLSIPSYNHDKIAFFHIDVEGFEYACMSGALEVIERSRPIIVYEQFILEETSESKQILSFLDSHSYHLWMLNELTGAKADCRNILAIPKEVDLVNALEFKYEGISRDPLGKDMAEYPCQRIFDGPALVPLTLDSNGCLSYPLNPWDSQFLFPAIECACSGRTVEAIRLLQDALSIYPDLAQLIYHAASLTEDSGLGIEYSQKLLKDRRNAPLGYWLYASHLHGTGDLEGALRQIGEGLNNYPSDAWLLKKCNDFVKRFGI